MVDTALVYREGSFDEAAFLEKAREQNVTQFRKPCEHARHAQDPRGFAAEEREGREFRFLKLSPQEGGGLSFSGWLDPEGGSQLRSALEPLARKSGVGDDRYPRAAAGRCADRVHRSQPADRGRGHVHGGDTRGPLRIAGGGDRVGRAAFRRGG